MTIFFFLIALGILIFVHEIGHFILAKRQGVKVEEFSLGFGPRIAGIKRNGTDYRVSALPFGGYVKMAGENPEDENADEPGSFAKKSVWQRVKIVAFGPLMNLVFSLAVMPIVFFIGRSEPVFLNKPPVVIGVLDSSPAAAAGMKDGDLILAIDGKNVSDWEEVLNKIIISPGSRLKLTIERDATRVGEDLFSPLGRLKSPLPSGLPSGLPGDLPSGLPSGLPGDKKVFERDIEVGGMEEVRGGYIGIEPTFFVGNEAVVGSVVPQSPASKAGIKPMDHVIGFDDSAVGNWIDLLQKINKTEGRAALLKIKREGETVSVSVKPKYNEETHRWLIGIVQSRQNGIPMEKVKYGIAASIIRGTKENIKLASLTFVVLKRLITGGLSYKVLGGPVIIAKASAVAAAAGLANFLYFLAFLSLQLAVINILPIPVLDGGHLLFLGIEAARRKPLSVKIRQYATQAGFFVLIAFMLIVTWNDLESMFGLRSLIKKLF